MHAKHTPIYQCLQVGRDSLNANNQGRAAYTATCAQAYACSSHREREVVEHLCTVPPGIGIAILSLTFIVEAIHLHGRQIHVSRFAKAVHHVTSV